MFFCNFSSFPPVLIVDHFHNFGSLIFLKRKLQVLSLFYQTLLVQRTNILKNLFQVLGRQVILFSLLDKKLHKVLSVNQSIFDLKVLYEKVLIHLHQLYVIAGFVTNCLLNFFMYCLIYENVIYFELFRYVKFFTKVFSAETVNPTSVNAGCFILCRGFAKQSFTLIGEVVFSWLFYLQSGLSFNFIVCQRLQFKSLELQLLKYNIKYLKMSCPQFSIVKALEFVGDNSNYQKRQLIYLGIIILAFATLTCRIPLMGSSLSVYFLFFSGVGQFVCPVYMSIRTISMCLLGVTGFTSISYLMPTFMFYLGLCAIGFFGRGLYVSALIYLGEIGGDKFRAWSTIIILALWGIAPLVLGLERLLKINSDLLWLVIFVLIPFFLGSYLVMTNWKPSPLHLFTKRQFDQAKIVLNQIAEANKRPALPYGLEGQADKDNLAEYKKITFQDMLSNSLIRKITIPLAILWIYRQYIYYSSYIIVPELGNQITKNLIMISASEIVAVLISYPIKLKIKRRNAYFLFVSMIAVSSIISSFTTLDEQCMTIGNSCFSKYVYRISIMVIRFSIALIGSILINYTMEIYPSDVRRTGFSLCLGLSSIGSTFMPWLVKTFIYINLSGFISFSIFSLIALYFILMLGQTNGQMRVQTLNQMEHGQAMFSLNQWAKLRFI